jgi:Icc-related predicted phosphoesterase
MKLIVTSDLHQRIAKWADLVRLASRELPRFVLVAGDLLPKTGGYAGQRRFFPALRCYLKEIREASPATVLLYFGNDDFHILEPLLDELAEDGLCVNLNGRPHREAGLNFCGMNKVRDHPFGYKHWCALDGEFGVSPVQFCGEGLTLNASGEYVPLANLAHYLSGKPTLEEELARVFAHVLPEEMTRSVWMIHQPPSDLGMDICADGQRIGSPTVVRFIREHQPLLGCSGHIHESPYQPGGQWCAWVGRTLWLQPGQVGRQLHCVTVQLSPGFQVESACHSLYGELRATPA